MSYDWLKALHVAAVLIWTGGMFLQSVVVALATRNGQGEGDDRALIAGVRSWDRRVTSPALLAVWVAGAALAMQGGWFAAGWLWVKLVAVVILSGLHGMQAGVLRRLTVPGTRRTLGVLGGMLGGWTPMASAVLVGLVAVLVVVKPL